MPPSRQSSLNSGGGGSVPSGSAQPAGQGGLMRASSLGAGSGGTAAATGSAATGQPSSGVTTAVDRGPSISPASMEAHIFGGSAGSRGPPQATMSFVNSFVTRPGSANAVNRRRSEQQFASPIEPSSSTQHHTPYSASNAAAQQYHHQHYGQHHPHANVFEEEAPRSASAIDDEDHKGHGLGRRSSMGFASSSGRWTPTILTNMLRRAGEGRFSPVGQSHSSSANQHVSPSSPHHRFFSPHSPRMKVLSTEPEEIQSHEHLSHDSTASKSQGRTRSSFIEQPSSGTRLGLVAERPLDEKKQSRLLGSAIQDDDDTHEKKKSKDAPRQQGKSRSGSEIEHRASGGAGAAAYYAPQSTLTTTGAHTPVQGRTSLQQHHSHAHKLSTSSTAASSHSIQMHSPQMHTHSRHTSLQSVRNAHRPQHSPILAPTNNSSPLVVPQARRGAVNLRKSNRRRKMSAAAKRQRAAMNAVPIHIKIFRLIGLLFWTICHPISAVNRAYLSISTSLHNIDMAFRDPRTGVRDWNPKWLGAYIPLLIWLGVSLSSTFTVLIWHTQVFQALDRLSAYLQSLGLLGRLIFGALIFLTTFPPLPLYSTLIILCGFSFGLWQGFIISYIAALSGAIVVFLMSRSLLKKWMVGLLNQSGGLKKVVRAIERRPKLLFLVRLAPYPYNLMNTLLASSPTLTLKTYTICTALALPKLLVHCGLGTTIKNFAAYNGAAVPEAPIGQGGTADGSEENGAAPMIGSDSQWADQSKASETAELVKHVAGFVGVGLCIGIFFYLYSVARKAVDEELDGDELAADEYELVSSDEAEDDDASSVDGLDDDHLNISSNGNLLGSRHGSSESMRIGDDLSASQRSSSQNGREAVLSPSILRPNAYAQGTSLMTDSRSGSGISSMVSQKSALAVEGTTPLFIAQSNGVEGAYGNGGGAAVTAGATGNASYFGAWSGKNGSTNHRASGRNDYPRIYMDSRASLADSIVEMEKHADLLEADGSQHDVICEYGDATPRHDISIELSPPPLGRRGKAAAATSNAGMYDKATGSAAESKASLLSGVSHTGERRGSSGDDGGSVDDRRRLMEVDRNRASRRSQMGYEEENVVGAR